MTGLTLLPVLPADREWRDRAACLGVDPNDMQPEVASPADVERAKAVCAGCPVRRECRDLAVSQLPGVYGVHAGEWWGEPPRDPSGVACGWCGAELDRGPTKPRMYCDGTCRQRAKRARRAVSA